MFPVADMDNETEPILDMLRRTLDDAAGLYRLISDAASIRLEILGFNQADALIRKEARLDEGLNPRGTAPEVFRVSARHAYIAAVLGAPGAGSPVLLTRVKLSQIAIGHQILQSALKLCQQAYELHLNSVRLKTLVREQQAIIDHISDGLLVLDGDGRVSHLNEPAGRILKLNPRYAKGKKFRSIFGVEPIIQPIFETGLGYRDRILHIKSQIYDLHLIDTAIPIKDEAGRVISIVNTFREVPQQRRRRSPARAGGGLKRLDSLIGRSAGFAAALRCARSMAHSGGNIFIEGEPGTGKRHFAQGIHVESGLGRHLFLEIDFLQEDARAEAARTIAGIALQTSDRRAVVSQGDARIQPIRTVYLRGIEHLTSEAITDLLACIRSPSKSIPRFISSSALGISELVNARPALQELYFSLAYFSFSLAPLRERPEDIEPLAQHFLADIASEAESPPMSLGDAALGHLQELPWLGNVRELRAELHSLALHHAGETLTRLPREMCERVSRPGEAAAASSLSLKLAESRMSAITQTGGNLSAAARFLGISRQTLYRKLRQLDPQPEPG